MSVPGSCALALLALARDKSGKTQTSGEKKKKTNQRKGCSCSISNPSSPEWESYEKAGSHKTPGQEVWKSGLRIYILPAIKIPRVLEEQSSGTCRDAQQPEQAPRHAGSSGQHVLSYLCISMVLHACVPQSSRIPARKAAFGPDGFFLATALPFGSRSQQNQCTQQHKACGRAEAGLLGIIHQQCPGREGTSCPPWLAGQWFSTKPSSLHVPSAAIAFLRSFAASSH